jgi:organic hydroperoxide reductase OsmC/OhrA
VPKDLIAKEIGLGRIQRSCRNHEVMELHTYDIDIVGFGPKTGRLGSAQGLPELLVASPPEFGGPIGVWSPEHLFVASVAACLMTTFRSIAEMSGLEVVAYSDSASGTLVRGDDRLYKMTEITLRPRVEIADPAMADRALRLLAKAEKVCLISRSIASEVHIEPSVDIAVAA